MSEFELRRRLGALRTEREPERDLWPSIAARLAEPAAVATAAPARRRFRYAPFAVAAGVAMLALLGTLMGARHHATLVAEQQREDAARRVAAEIAVLDASYRGAETELGRIAPVPPQARANPALENASATLTTAEAELRGSLATDPRAEFLLDLLARAKAKQIALERMKRA